MSATIPRENPIDTKVAYVKMLFLVKGKIKDDKSYDGIPVMMRDIRNESNVPVFDTALFYTFTRFNTAQRPNHFSWVFTSEDGKIDDTLQLYPFEPNIIPSGDGTFKNDKLWKKKVDPRRTDHVVTVAHWYNAFREGAEWAGARADDNTSEIHLTVDFTSVITAPGKGNLLFREKPYGVIVDGLTEARTPVAASQYNNGRIFSVVKRDLSKDDILRIDWKLNWENLAEWHGVYHDQSFTPKKTDEEYELTL